LGFSTIGSTATPPVLATASSYMLGPPQAKGRSYRSSGSLSIAPALLELGGARKS
jgi:hypothetical protein